MIAEAINTKSPSRSYASTRNACKLCAPFGACIVFRGISGCIPLIHGSQGCSTYIRRYGISHFREPIDIASSNFTESTAIFGGRDNLESALSNVTRQYKPEAIGVTSTCLSETIGENVPMYIAQYEKDRSEREKNGGAKEPALFYASTPSYRGTHMDGFHEAIYSVVSKLAGTSVASENVEEPKHLNLISGFVSSEDLRELHKILSSFEMPYTLLPDYSESLDGGSWEEYQKLPKGGTPLESIRRMSSAVGTITLGESIPREHDASAWLESNFGVKAARVPMPIGIENTDAFFSQLTEFTGRPISQKWMDVRGRLIDAYIDGHKYCFGKKAIVYGEEDFVLAICSFLSELGIEPVLVATGAVSDSFKSRILSILKKNRSEPIVMDDADFVTMLEKAKDLSPDFVMGSSKGFYLAKNLEIPLIRCGFPIHDRMGGHRILHLGYRGTLNLFDLVCNTLMQIKQSSSKIGYTYI